MGDIVFDVDLAAAVDKAPPALEDLESGRHIFSGSPIYVFKMLFPSAVVLQLFCFVWFALGVWDTRMNG